jgi:OFA family oxalate/formate antiporter-like MFS transporter
VKLNRWVILSASILINMCIGSAYAWSVFQNPLISLFGWTTTQASLAFTISLALVPISMIFAGRLQDLYGPKYVTLAGGCVFGLGIFLTSTITSLTGLYLYYGLLGGLGIGMVYACMVGNTMKWFPDKRGLAGGLIAMGFGLGAVVFAPLGVNLISNYGVLNTFAIFGIVFSSIIIVASFFLAAPAKVSTTQQTAAQTLDLKNALNAQEMVKTPKFYTLWVLYAIGCIGGLMIIGHASPIVQQKVGLLPQEAALIVSFLGIANSLGRVFWGTMSDRFGRMPTLIATYIVSALCLMTLSWFSTLTLTVIGLAGIALCFGGYLGIMPSICADFFGSKHIGINYGILFTAYGVAAVVGPRLASWIKDMNAGSYDVAFTLVMFMNIVAIVIGVLLVLKKSKSPVLDITAQV